MLCLVDVFHCFLDALVLLDELEGAVRPDATNGARVVAPAQDAQVDELMTSSIKQAINREMNHHGDWKEMTRHAALVYFMMTS